VNAPITSPRHAYGELPLSNTNKFVLERGVWRKVVEKNKRVTF
jgi:hypothetical protein